MMSVDLPEIRAVSDKQRQYAEACRDKAVQSLSSIGDDDLLFLARMDLHAKTWIEYDLHKVVDRHKDDALMLVLFWAQRLDGYPGNDRKYFPSLADFALKKFGKERLEGLLKDSQDGMEPSVPGGLLGWMWGQGRIAEGITSLEQLLSSGADEGMSQGKGE